MKEIVAIIRPSKMAATKTVLEGLGFPAMTANRVLGRGKQKAIVGEIGFEVDNKALLDQPGNMRYIPKTMITLIVADEDANLVAEAIMRVNKSGQYGDGKIFVCPIEEVVRVRTSEKGDSAI